MAEDGAVGRLQVANARPQDAGRGIARIGRSILAQLGASEGGAIEIIAKQNICRATVTRAVRQNFGACSTCPRMDFRKCVCSGRNWLPANTKQSGIAACGSAPSPSKESAGRTGAEG